jgi:hypothetical protein
MARVCLVCKHHFGKGSCSYTCCNSESREEGGGELHSVRKRNAEKKKTRSTNPVSIAFEQAAFATGDKAEYLQE